MKLTYCPSTLAEGYETYSPVALKNLFAGKKVSHILPYDCLLYTSDAADD